MAEKNDSASGLPFGSGMVTEIDRLTKELAGPNRRMRQEAAHNIAQMVKQDPTSFDDKADTLIPALVDALLRPEAQTRWESMAALAELAAAHADLVADAYDGAEASLFDEQSSPVRIAAFRLLARLGATSEEMSDKVWPLLDEAIQCFHGDPGYRDMLSALLALVQGEASEQTRTALVERISFDAESGRGYVKACSAEIVEAAKAK